MLTIGQFLMEHSGSFYELNTLHSRSICETAMSCLTRSIKGINKEGCQFLPLLQLDHDNNWTLDNICWVMPLRCHLTCLLLTAA